MKYTWSILDTLVIFELSIDWVSSVTFFAAVKEFWTSFSLRCLAVLRFGMTSCIKQSVWNLCKLKCKIMIFGKQQKEMANNTVTLFYMERHFLPSKNMKRSCHKICWANGTSVCCFNWRKTSPELLYFFTNNFSRPMRSKN